MWELSLLAYYLINFKSVLTSSWILHWFLVFTSRNINSPTEHAHKLHKTQVFSRSVQEWNKGRDKGRTHTRVLTIRNLWIACTEDRRNSLFMSPWFKLTKLETLTNLLLALTGKENLLAVPVNTMKSNAIQKIRCKKNRLTWSHCYLKHGE